eukprot:SM001980S05342  [mRNA]  locus=s1980:63:1700:+ [translate_table: standard]
MSPGAAGGTLLRLLLPPLLLAALASVAARSHNCTVVGSVFCDLCYRGSFDGEADLWLPNARVGIECLVGGVLRTYDVVATDNNGIYRSSNVPTNESTGGALEYCIVRLLQDQSAVNDGCIVPGPCFGGNTGYVILAATDDASDVPSAHFLLEARAGP